MNQASPETFRAFEAATGKPIEPDYSSSTLEDVERACAAAEGAFDTYRELPADKRASFLEAIGDEIMAIGDDLLERAHKESGLPMARLTGERGRTVGQLKLFAEVVREERWRGVRIDPALPDREPAPRPDLRLRMIPLGPVAIFGASNFPLAFSTAGGDTASALAAGCPVVIKGHPAHPGTDTMVFEAMKRAASKTGMPDGVVNHLTGASNEIGGALVQNPHIAAVGFTGSRGGGLALQRLAQQRDVPIPVYAEMSSVNPVVLMPDALAADAEKLGKGFVSSLVMGAGQFCTNPGLILAIDGDDLRTFEAAAAEALKGQKAQTMLTTDIAKSYSEGAKRLSGAPGIEELARGEAGDGVTCDAARLFAASGAAVKDHPELLEEVFGASSLIVRCADMDELRDLLRDLEGQLTATLYMKDGDAEEAATLVPILERTSGRILVNGWPTGVEVAHAMVHGGPYPATTDARTTSVGTLAIDRFLRPVSYQALPERLLPAELRDDSSAPRMVDGKPA
ncbi:aldehyde dehydrogenase (NADP(+)) [Aurantiacibacter spongiae]|uniref:Aldehyde dehydrogenase (NADP(+)) n=1 Tax=Aurantiacibacter spongiae TaxID=2488860 RepID=A0A3N5CU45_9SPHN|nr:aldehyde dehydrogenase (NADP(+)) [Aurantiacibacter spongiae]RPF70940.1 aldehyde dehydrogenase (NADP(+)) [Aurantiacibacter spongiae]